MKKIGRILWAWNPFSWWRRYEVRCFYLPSAYYPECTMSYCFWFKRNASSIFWERAQTRVYSRIELIDHFAGTSALKWERE